MKTYHLPIAIICSASIILSCDRSTDYETSAKPSEIVLDPSISDETRSLGDMEDVISDGLTIYIFDKDGALAERVRLQGLEKAGIMLEGGLYRAYALANAGKIPETPTEGEIRNIEINAEGISSDYGIPMSWSGEIEAVSGRKTEISIGLEKLAAVVNIRLDMGMIPEMEVTSLRVHQAASVIRPFMKDGSRNISADEAIDGDAASDSEIEDLMSGKEIRLFIPENCQGSLLQGNTDPWKKVPENIGDAAGLCTYIEMKGRWKEEAAYEGEITYRFYLGEDSASDFNIRRNSCQNVSMCPEEVNLDRDSWKLDTSKMTARYTDITIGIDDDNHLYAISPRSVCVGIAIDAVLKGHIRCVTVQDPFFTIWGHYFREEVSASYSEEVTIGRDTTRICGDIFNDIHDRLREIEFYSVLDAWKISDFRYPVNERGTIREYLKPYEASAVIKISSGSCDIKSFRSEGQLTYDYEVSEPVSWYTSIFTYRTLVPSSYSGFDNRLDDDGCPPGNVFKAETVHITPDITFTK